MTILDIPGNAHRDHAPHHPAPIVSFIIVASIITASHHSAARSNIAGSVNAISSIVDAMPCGNRHPLTNP